MEAPKTAVFRVSCDTSLASSEISDRSESLEGGLKSRRSTSLTDRVVKCMNTGSVTWKIYVT